MSGSNRLEGAVARSADVLLPKVAALFAAHGIRYCLDGGTLLGIVREGRLLPWDDDLDFFVPFDQAEKIAKLKWQLLRLGCKLKQSYAKDSYGPIPKGGARIYKIAKIRRHRGQRVIIDLIFKYPDATHYHWAVGLSPVVHKKVPRHFYDRFGAVTYKGVSYPIPSNVEDYLTARYGNWKEVKKDWDFRTDDYVLRQQS